MVESLESENTDLNSTPSLFVLYFPSGVPDLSSAGSASPTKTQRERVFFFRFSQNVYIYIFVVCVVEWFHSSAHCLQENQSQGDGATSEAWSVYTGSH